MIYEVPDMVYRGRRDESNASRLLHEMHRLGAEVLQQIDCCRVDRVLSSRAIAAMVVY